MSYCPWCGNNPPVDGREACSDCFKLLDEHLQPAWEGFDMINARWGFCCRGIIVNTITHIRSPDTTGIPEGAKIDIADGEVYEKLDRTHIYVHPKHDAGVSNNGTLSVECGINLYYSFARCYWIFDGGDNTESFEYGPEIPYSIGEKRFFEAVETILDAAADEAEGLGYAQCSMCGDHYLADAGLYCECQVQRSIEP